MTLNTNVVWFVPNYGHVFCGKRYFQLLGIRVSSKCFAQCLHICDDDKAQRYDVYVLLIYGCTT